MARHRFGVKNEGLLAAIVATIRRIDDGTYGICGACGVAIGYVDLSESPTATLCVNCLSDADWRP